MANFADTRTQQGIRMLKESMARFLVLIAVYGVFFYLYRQTGSDDYSFIPAIAVIVGFYLVSEILTAFWDYFFKKNNESIYSSEIDQRLLVTLKKLSETIETKKNETHNGNLEKSKDIIKC